MKISIISIFPEMFAPLNHSIVGRAQKKDLVQIQYYNPRDFADNKWQGTDDYAYGGEPGMVMKPEPLARAIRASEKTHPAQEIIFMTPQGEKFDQKIAFELSQLDSITILCGHYKGIDERIRKKYVTREISIGDFVLTGGEIPAMVLSDSIVRLLPDVLGDDASAQTDSFFENKLGWPLYTRPVEFEGMKVPEILLSGHHEKIRKWREKESLKRTNTRRPDLLKIDQNQSKRI